MIYVAAITPRGPQLEIDFGAAFEFIDFLCGARVGGIVLFGATGEYPSLAAEERCRLLYLAVKRSRVPVIAGVGTATLDHSLALACRARDAGAAALLLPPPFFYPYQPEEIREFYLEFARHFGGGVPVYAAQLIPPAAAIGVETAREILSGGYFAGIEDTTGELAGAGLPVLAANDARFGRARCTGTPAISAAACALPELMMALDCALAAGQRDEAARLEGRLGEFLAWVDAFPSPVLIKAAVAQRGFKTGPLAAPLTGAQERRLGEFREWFSGWSRGR